MKMGSPQMHEHQVRQYFNNFVYANREALADLFTDDVSLVDWDINVYGKEVVLAAFDSIWSALSDITVEFIRLDLIGGQAYCTITIDAPELDEPLNVIDVIGFDENNQINSITAYKR